MKKAIGKYEVELSGSLITVKYGGELRGAKEVNPSIAVERYNEVVKVYEKRELELTILNR